MEALCTDWDGNWKRKFLVPLENRLPGFLSEIRLCTEKSWRRRTSITTTTKKKQCNVTTNCTGKIPSWELSVPQLTKNYPNFSESKCSLSWSEEPDICLIPSQRNPIHTLPSCCINPLKPELNPICYLLALLGAHHFLHVSRIRVKSLTFRRLMSNIYGAPILDVSRSHTTTQHSR